MGSGGADGMTRQATAKNSDNRGVSGWRHVLPVLMGLGLFVLGVVALTHLLRPVRAEDIVDQIRTTPWSVLFQAGAATLAAYVALIGYDWSALRYLGKSIPLRIVAVGGFLGYSFGNTVGVSILSGGAVRYRIYSAFGLNALEVASVSTFVALAFGIGITVIGLGAVALHPEALQGLLPLPVGVVRWGAVASLVGLMAVMLWLSASGRALRWRNFEIAMPRPGLLLGQLGFTLADTAAAAATLYVLLPEGAPEFATFLALFTAASMLGVLSHVPGGVGVFESIVIAAMPAGVPLDQVAAALLLYRVIYYLVPFALALAFVALNEARLAGGFVTRLIGEAPAPLRPVMRAVTGATPALAGLTAFGLGTWLILASLMPAVRPDQIGPDDLLAAILLEGGAILSSMLGVLLLILSQGLARRISGAFWLTQIALAGGAVAALLNGWDWESAALLAATLLVLAPFRREFYRSAPLTRGVFSPAWFMLVAGLIAGAVAFFVFMHEAIPYPSDLWSQFSGQANMPRALRAALAGSALLLALAVWVATQPVRAHTRRPDAAALRRAADIIAGHDDPRANIALSGDKALFFADAEDAFIAYASHGQHRIAYGDPVGPDRAIGPMAWAFQENAHAHGAVPIFHEVSDRHRALWTEMGLVLQKIGEDPVVRLKGLLFGDPRLADLRAALEQPEVAALQVEVLQPPHDPALLEELEMVSVAWQARGTGREKGFAVGRFDTDYLDRFPLAIAWREGRVTGFASVLTAAGGKRLSVDLVRFLPDEGRATMTALFAELIRHFRDRGAEELGLGLAPIAGLDPDRSARLWRRFGSTLYRQGAAFEDFESLRAFKAMFAPDWRPRYIALPPTVPPLVALRNVAELIGGRPPRRPRQWRTRKTATARE